MYLVIELSCMRYFSREDISQGCLAGGAKSGCYALIVVADQLPLSLGHMPTCSQVSMVVDLPKSDFSTIFDPKSGVRFTLKVAGCEYNFKGDGTEYT